MNLAIVNDRSPEFYQYYPRLFESYFEVKDKDTVEKLCQSGYSYYHSVLLLDSLIDDHVFQDIPRMLDLQEESIKVLSSVFGMNSSFWNLWNKRKKEYFEAVQLEKSFNGQIIIDFRDYGILADKKAAFGKVAIDSLYVLDGESNEEIYDLLLQSHKYFSIGFQLYDDVRDFKVDFEKGQFNYAIYSLSTVIDFKEYGNNVGVLNKLLYIRGIGQEVLIKSGDNFLRALSILKEFNTKSEWREVVTDMKNSIDICLAETNGYLETLNAKLELLNHPTSEVVFFEYSNIEDGTVTSGLDYIKSDFEHNLAELKHIMYLGDLEGFRNKSSVHMADTFQRAILSDCLISVMKTYDIDINPFLESEIQYLIKYQNSEYPGGWSYFPTVHEIAPDIDDLGQIIQLFINSGKKSLVDEYCSEAISTALDDRVDINGGIETWIVPKRDQSELHQRQEYFNTTKWGKGPDVEVVANYIYALNLYDGEQFQRWIEQSSTYIAEQQNDMGFWESRWYYGRYYGTYVCLRLLQNFKNRYSIEIKNALGYLSDCQNTDGGFAMEPDLKSDSLSTSLALLSLKLFYPKKNNEIDRAIEYLRNTQNADGSWEEIDFIKPKVHEPYKSKTITTAYALKAICE